MSGWSATPQYQVGAEVLGYYGLVAAWRRASPNGGASKHYNHSAVIISSAGGAADGAYEPAQSVTINTKEGLIGLRRAVDEALGDVRPVENLIGLRAHLRLAVTMLRDYREKLRGLDGDCDATSWEAVREDLEAAFDALAGVKRA